MEFSRVKIVTFAPHDNADSIRSAMGKTGAGSIGEYSHCSFSSDGVGRFRPSENAQPHIGTPGVAESVDEERIEIVCDRDKARAVIDALIDAHPYEEVAYDIYPLVTYDEL
jgi:hypothetical protein